MASLVQLPHKKKTYFKKIFICWIVVLRCGGKGDSAECSVAVCKYFFYSFFSSFLSPLIFGLWMSEMLPSIGENAT